MGLLGDLTWRVAQPIDQAAMAGYDALVADVEASLARAFRMLLEAVDRKIDGEVGATHGELAALLEESWSWRASSSGSTPGPMS
jgi:SUN domain-containing protein 1/2